MLKNNNNNNNNNNKNKKNKRNNKRSGCTKMFRFFKKIGLNIIYIFSKTKRICIGIYVLFIQLILSLLFSITLILQSLINLVEKVNINNADNVFLIFNKKYERKKVVVFNNIEEYNKFNITKLFYYYISIYMNIVNFLYYNMLYKMKKKKKDLSGEDKIFMKKLKINLKNKRKFSFFINFFLNIFNIINILLFGHIVFLLLCLLTMNNIFQKILTACI
ncbi:hypothetical protein PFLG_00691, partial [Plasmodium falciparum RAJ116]